MNEPNAKLISSEQLWQRQTADRERLGILYALVLMIIIVPLWSPVDFLLAPSSAMRFAVLRALDVGVYALALVGVLTLQHTDPQRELARLRLLFQGVGFVTYLSIAWMLPPQTENFFAYLLGFSLLVWGTGFLFAWPLQTIAISVFSMVGALGLSYYAQGTTQSTEHLVGAAFYLFGATLVASGSSMMRLRILRQAHTVQTRLSKAKDKLAHAYTEARTAHAANHAKSVFLAQMSHELRTPMNAIQGYTELVQEGLDDPDQRQDLQRVLDASAHLLALIDDLLDLSRVEAGKLELHYEPTDLAEIANNVRNTLDPLATEKGLVLRLQVLSNPGRLRTDPTKLKQVLLNLVGNALKFTEEGEISIEIDHDLTHAFLRVQDTGIGLSAEEITDIFEPYNQAIAGQQKHGTGLGLTISRELCRALGGDLVARSTLGHGTLFTVTLPRDIAPST